MGEVSISSLVGVVGKVSEFAPKVENVIRGWPVMKLLLGTANRGIYSVYTISTESSKVYLCPVYTHHDRKRIHHVLNATDEDSPPMPAAPAAASAACTSLAAF